ncbi:MAG: hypothetical protein NTZ59_07350 [Bacteroidetes bacterium]|nr:hypothetical protein [Bacteroidota bacterium]
MTSANIFGQFYYSDIVSIKNTNANYVLCKNSKVKSITVKNVMARTEDENSVAVKEVFKKNWQEKNTQTNMPNGSERTFITTYANDKISRKDDDGLNVNSLIRYEYSGNNLSAIRTSSVDTSAEFSDGFFEKHLFEYDAQGLPNKMYKIKNNADTTTIVFVKDEANNIGEEKWYRKNDLIETYYYYYNDKKQLTDIVRFNAKYEKMLPEFLFEYNDNNQVVQMTQIPFGSSNYTVTKYTYDEKGLKTLEKIFTKRGDLLNKMEYVYEF